MPGYRQAMSPSVARENQASLPIVGDDHVTFDFGPAC